VNEAPEARATDHKDDLNHHGDYNIVEMLISRWVLQAMDSSIWRQLWYTVLERTIVDKE
jgi:hypothetical protein